MASWSFAFCFFRSTKIFHEHNALMRRYYKAEHAENKIGLILLKPSTITQKRGSTSLSHFYNLQFLQYSDPTKINHEKVEEVQVDIREEVSTHFNSF